MLSFRRFCRFSNLSFALASCNSMPLLCWHRQTSHCSLVRPLLRDRVSYRLKTEPNVQSKSNSCSRHDLWSEAQATVSKSVAKRMVCLCSRCFGHTVTVAANQIRALSATFFCCPNDATTVVPPTHVITLWGSLAAQCAQVPTSYTIAVHE